MIALKGLAISPGISIGPAFQFSHAALKFEIYEPADPGSEWSRFEQAHAACTERLQGRYQLALSTLGAEEAAIFRAHLTILGDPELLTGTKQEILGQRKNAEAAVQDVSEMYCRQLESIDDEYIRARVLDIRDVRDDLLRVLLGLDGAGDNWVTKPSILISRSLAPSDCISMDRRMLLGFCTLEGGTTSHVAILARSLGVPAIAGIDERALEIHPGTEVILDGDSGRLLHSLEAATIREYEDKKASRSRVLAEAKKQASLPPITKDGRQVLVVANLGSADQDSVQACLEQGAEGVGLLRTEFVYLAFPRMPDEELQYAKYRTITDLFGQRPVILRTIDIGGDKQLPYFELPKELNPFLGVRGIRLSLRHPDMFKVQLRAALRAGHGRNLQLMFPMVTKASEIREARTILEQCKAELKAESVPFADDLEVGIMVEVPAAALMADQLAEEVDFFSIGTNDLSQYTLAMDRTNNELSDLVDALDPSVLRLIAGVIDAAHKKEKRVGVCGELAGEPLAIPILLGLGLDEFSMNSPAIPMAKRILRTLRMADVKSLALQVLEFENSEQVRECVIQHLPALRDPYTSQF